uniref:NADH dehydrogenase subunit 2 n=1 Tax=Trichuris muris TaxID=70415 RepID=A0A0S3M493_TRIMR|nr:NADH dehydrogenase subunit 2 [Trichuris muris]BAT21240.1 NADH dehydrogenase subunit 2 [Trichuris muris]
MNMVIWYYLYFLIILLSTSMSNWISMWTMLELSTWLMTIISIKTNYMYDLTFKMYLLLSLSSMMLIMLWLCTNFKQEWLIFIIAFKLGIPPLHWWMMWTMKHMSWNTMWWFTTFHKLIPMIISMMIMNSLLMFWWCCFSVVWSSLSFWNSSSMFIIMFYSSCVHTSWLWMTSIDLFSFLFYFLIYTMTMYMIFLKMNYLMFWWNSIDFTTSIIILLGIPTSAMFFAKMITLSTYFGQMVLLCWIILLVNIMTIFPYTRMIWNSIMSNMYIPLKYQKPHNKTFSVLVIMLFVTWPVLL